MLNTSWLEMVARQPETAPANAEPVVWHETFPGVAYRPLATGPEMMIVQMRFDKGSVAKLHRHSSAQAGYVLEGKLRITLPDQQLTVSAGHCYLLPPNVAHQFRAAERSVVIDVFAPGQASVRDLDFQVNATSEADEAALRTAAAADASLTLLPFVGSSARLGGRRRSRSAVRREPGDAA